MEDTPVTQKHETPAEKVARLEAELRQAKESLVNGFKVGDTVYIKGKIYDDPDVDGDIEVEHDYYNGEAFSTFKPHQLTPAADFIPRAEHERLVEEARAATPQDCEQEPVGYVGMYGNGQMTHTLFRTKKDAQASYSTYMPLYTRPAPLTEQEPVKTGWDGLKDGDECWIRCEVKDAEKLTVTLPDGSDFNSMWYVHPNNIAAAPVPPAPAPAVAPKGVVETQYVLKVMRTGVVVEGGDRKYVQVYYQRGGVPVPILADPSEVFILDSALLAAANPAKEGEE